MLALSWVSTSTKTVSFTADRDLLLQGATGQGKLLISTDPSFTVSGFEGGANNNYASIYFYMHSLASASSMCSTPQNLKIPIKKGETIYLAIQAGGYIVYFDEAPAE